MADTTNTLTQALIPFIDKAQQGLDKGISFLSEQIPDVIQQLLLWKGISSFLFWLGLGVILPIILGIIDWKYYKWGCIQSKNSYNNNHMDEYPCFTIIISIGSLILWLVSLRSFFYNWAWLQILIAPKVYLLEYARSIIN